LINLEIVCTTLEATTFSSRLIKHQTQQEAILPDPVLKCGQVLQWLSRLLLFTILV